MEEWPEHRANFFLLLKAVVEHCFSGMTNIRCVKYIKETCERVLNVYILRLLRHILTSYTQYPICVLILVGVSGSCLALLKIAAEQFKLVLDSIVWAFKHTMRNVADTGKRLLLLHVYSNYIHNIGYTEIDS